MSHDKTDPSFVIAHICCLEMLGLILAKCATFEIFMTMIPPLFDQSVSFILDEMKKHPNFDWQSLLISCPNFIREALVAIQRNCQQLIEEFKEFVPSLN